MSVFNRRWVSIVFLLSWACTVFASQSKEVYHRSFWHPYFHGERLAYCSANLQECGMAIATKYCRIMGYEKADQEVIAYNVGLTHYFPSSEQCKGWQCNGFKTIRCANKITHKPPMPYHYRLKNYTTPRFNHYRVDWCYDGKTGCGKRAAFSFCRRLGFMEVRKFKLEENVQATQAIGNQKLCFGNECKSFSFIQCFR